MAEKRYYWLKLKEDYFNSPKIKKLRKIAGGDTFTIIYLKMQLLSIRNEGVISFEGIEPTFEEELALKLDEEVEDVKLTLAYLNAQGLYEINDNNECFLIEASNNIGSEGQSAERKRQFDARKKEKALLSNDSVTDTERSSLSISNSISISKDNIEDKNKKNKSGIPNVNQKKTNIDNTETQQKYVEGLNYSENLKNSIKIWLSYKKEKKQVYKPTGFETLIKKLDKDIEEFGEQYVIDSIENSIVNNYSGIFAPKNYNNQKYSPLPAKESKPRFAAPKVE